MRTSVTFLLVVLLMAGLGWLWWGGGAAAPAEIGHPGGSTALVPNGDLPGTGRQEPQEPTAEGGPEVWVEVTPRARVLPPSPRLPVIVRRGRDRVPARVVAVAGAGTAWFGSLRPGPTLLRIDLGHGGALFRSVTVPAPAAPVEVVLGADAFLRGRIVGPDSAPVAGARVWCGVVPCTVRPWSR